MSIKQIIYPFIVVLISASIGSCKTVTKEKHMTENNQINLEKLKQEFVQYSSPHAQDILYRPSVPVKDILDPRIQQFIHNMKTHLKGKGIGLAANQLGKPLQIFMIEYQAGNPRYHYLKFPSVPLQVFINPKITAASQEKVSFWHGCLSAIDKPKGLLATYKWIEYEAYDEDGTHKTGRLDGLAAVIFQHEFRHLLGSLYIDHAKEFRSGEELTRLFEEGKLQPYAPADKDVPLLLSDYIVGTPI